jgi:hypothetical protein
MADTPETRSWPSRASDHSSRFKLSRMQVSVLLSILFLFVIQRIAFEVLGTGPTGTLLIDALTILANSLAIGCCIAASRSGRGLSRLFWLLLGSASTLELIGNVGWAYYRYSHVAVPDIALFPSLFYRLEAAPLAIALFLSEETRSSKLGSFLDSCMVVGLVGVATYQVQMAELNAHDPKIWQLIGMGMAVNAILALVAIARYSLTASGYLRGLFARQAIYLFIYLTISLPNQLRRCISSEG